VLRANAGKLTLSAIGRVVDLKPQQDHDEVSGLSIANRDGHNCAMIFTDTSQMRSC